MNSASCLLPLAIVGIPTMLFCIERDQERRREAARRACFDFDLSLARRRYREQTECDETEALRVEEEFRRFFLLIAENPDTQFGLHKEEPVAKTKVGAWCRIQRQPGSRHEEPNDFR